MRSSYDDKPIVNFLYFKKLKQELMTKRRVTLSYFLRIYLFFIITSVELIINVGTGIISFASKRIKSELLMNDKEFSLFDSVNSFGRAFGSLIFMIISNKYDRQYTFIFFITIKGILLIIFYFSRNSLTLIILRFFIGIVHMPPSIYIPIWIDQYGIKKYKTVQLTIKTFSVPMGKVIGYLFCYYFDEINVKIKNIIIFLYYFQWYKGFVFEGIYLFIISILIFSSSNIFFSHDLYQINNKENEEDIFESNSNIKIKQKDSIIENIKFVLKNIFFIIFTLTKAIASGTKGIIQFWSTDYIRNALKVDDSKKIVLTFTTVSIAGPFGAIFFSSFISKFFGDYESKNAIKIAIRIQFFNCIIGLFIPFMPNLNSYCLILLIFFILNATILSFFNGLIIKSVEPKYKATALSLSSLALMLLIDTPFPFIYGCINDYFSPKGYKHYGLLSILLIHCCTLILLFILRNIENNDNDDNYGKSLEFKMEDDEDFDDENAALVNK